MVYYEAALMSLIGLVGVFGTLTDIKNGIIKNKTLLIITLTGVVINAIYLSIFVKSLIKIYFINLAFVAGICICLYAFKFWAAGDSKLLICIISLYPVRLYSSSFGYYVPGVGILVMIFLIAYIYVILDSIIQFLKREKYFNSGKINVKGLGLFLKSYAISFIYLRALSLVLGMKLADFYYNNIIAFYFVNIFIAVIVYEKSFFKKWYCIFIVLAINVLCSWHMEFNLWSLNSYLILLISLILKRVLSGYNYKNIKTQNVEPGMVLSYITVMKFQKSAIKNLPKSTEENIKSRITEIESDAIKRWETSKYGEGTIIIVRKIPFAIFVALGTAIYFLSRVI